MGRRKRTTPSGLVADLDPIEKLRLRVELLGLNPYFQPRLSRVRTDLSIPEVGFAGEVKLGEWLYQHFKAHCPLLVPPEHSGKGYTTSHVYAIQSIVISAQLWFRDGFIPRYGMDLNALPLVQSARQLLTAFRLTENLLGPLAWYILTGEVIPVDAVRMMDIQVFGDTLSYEAALEEDARGGFHPDPYLIWLPKGSEGAVAVIRLLVNEQTKKKDWDTAWGQIKTLQKRFPRGPGHTRPRAVSVDEWKSWIPRYVQHRIEGKSLFKLADESGYPENTLRYQFDQLDEIFVRPETGNP